MRRYTCVMYIQVYLYLLLQTINYKIIVMITRLTFLWPVSVMSNELVTMCTSLIKLSVTVKLSICYHQMIL